MAVAAVNIDLSNTYDIETITGDLKESTFKTELKDGSSAVLKIEISNESHELMPEVYNLAFGPLNAFGRIDDKAELPHKDYSKMFSTIILEALTYLRENNGHYIGIDGSDIRRAYLYTRFIQSNYDYLTGYFNILGLKYYVRINRFGKTQYQNPFDFEDILVSPQKIEKTEKINVDTLYNYFIFNLK